MSTYSELPAYSDFGLPSQTPTKHYALYIVGPKGGCSRRSYVCHECRETVDTESARYPLTRHSLQAAWNHVNEHFPVKLFDIVSA